MKKHEFQLNICLADYQLPLAAEWMMKLIITLTNI